MPYQVTLKKRAVKALEKINEPYYTNLKKAIYSLADNPRPYGYKKLHGRDSYSFRVAEYRIIYEIIDKTLIVDVVDLGLRKNIYE